MNKSLIKLLSFFAILAVVFSVAVCTYLAFGEMTMTHQGEMAMLRGHFEMAQSFLNIIIPINIILIVLVSICVLFVFDNVGDLLLHSRFYFFIYKIKERYRLVFRLFNPRSPPLY